MLEMEYLSDARSLVQALRQLPRGERRSFQREVAERLLYTVLSHIFLYQDQPHKMHVREHLRDGRSAVRRSIGQRSFRQC